MTPRSAAAGLFGPLEPWADELPALRTRLANAALTEQLLDVSFTTTHTPVGTVLLAATERGLVRVAFCPTGPDTVLQHLSDQVSPRLLHARARLEPALRELDAYFAGTLHRFDLPLDLRLAHGFRREVLDGLRRIPYATTATYAAVAADLGRPNAVRAVGTACARNPLPLVIPCHRVVRSDGSPGAYAGGTGAKLALLALERRSRRDGG